MGPKVDNKTESSKGNDDLEELVFELNDITEDIRATKNLGIEAKTSAEKNRKFKARITRLDSTWEKLSSRFFKARKLAVSLRDEGTLTHITSMHAEAREDYYEAISLDLPENASAVTPQSHAIHSQLSKLPSIPIPVFKGDYVEWCSYKDTFVSLIHDNPDVPPIQKFHYLKGSLKGLALQIIAKIATTADSYPQAWDALIKKYDNKRILAATYLSDILNSKPILKGNREALEKFANSAIESALCLVKIPFDDPAGFILLRLLLRIIDPITREKFDSEFKNKEGGPGLDDFVNFIHQQCEILQSGCLATSTPHAKSDVFQKRATLVSTTFDSTEMCPLCKDKHRLFKCPRFNEFTPVNRYRKVKSFDLCVNCLSPHHAIQDCTSNQMCKLCNQRHHTTLHFKTPNTKEGKSKPQTPNKLKPQFSAPLKSGSTEREPIEGISGVPVLAGVTNGPIVLLGTAFARIQDASGNWVKIRLVLDSGSQRSIITSACANRLGLKYKRSPYGIYGLSGSLVKGGKYQVECSLTPCSGTQPQLYTSAVVMRSIIPQVPYQALPSEVYTTLNPYQLADPSFGQPGNIDFLLGADLFGEILSSEAHQTNTCFHTMNTVFGTVIIGKVDLNQNSPNDIGQTKSLTLLTTSLPLDKILERFWETEEVKVPPILNPQEVQAENYFSCTHYRNEEGRYIVRLPFKNPENVILGNSYYGALNRFQKLETRLNRNPELKLEYTKLLKDYLDKGYMYPAPTKGEYFLPHHCVVKASDPKKLRIVLDASMSTASGSLNDHLLVGPKLHLDIKDVILNFRRYPIALTADITEMFLRILLPGDGKYQHLLYRFTSEDAVQEFELSTLSFGQTSSPYLALRVIRQLVQDEGGDFPRAGRSLLNETYVDDILTGANTVSEAIKLQKELVALLAKGSFSLKRWSSNEIATLKFIPEKQRGTSISFSGKEDATVTILGMMWDPVTDEFSYRTRPPELKFSKRAVLSVIARLYDPLGYLAPVIFRAKAFLQELWAEKLDWDDELPAPLKQRWSEFLPQLSGLSSLRIPRYLFTCNASSTSIIGFADASSLGYAAALYIRVQTPEGNYKSSLIYAKTKLAPLKTITIPRLELCGALLLAKSLKSCQTFVADLHVQTTILCTDSSVVLSWLATSPHKLKVFVANRVTKILEQSAAKDWYHVASRDNPADLASRGLAPSDISHQSLWWQGPPWLQREQGEWSLSQNFETSIPDLRQQVMLITHNQDNCIKDWIEKFSSFSRLKRSLSFALRFARNCKPGMAKNVGELTLPELRYAQEVLIKFTQKHYFKEDLSAVKKGKHPSATMSSLSPFLDTSGVLRVGGRLSNSPLMFQEKHPILLPAKAHVSTLIVDYLHKAYLHAGPQLLHSLTQRQFWILSARRLIRSRVHHCLTCHKLRVKNITPYMADLPSTRFQQGRAFINTGVDFAGPFLLRDSMRRKFVVTKAYVCLFVCLSTKAVHLELVTQLSTEAFLASLDRFVARRGLPTAMFSDHGTNFVGADRQLRELSRWFTSNQTQETIKGDLAQRSISWRFIPPSAPHFGGLWEAGVRSFKTHMVRVLGQQPLTYEEFYTVVTRIEAILNSRPLYPISTSPDEYDTLTPGHFLVGGPLVEAYHPDLTQVPMNRLSRWQLLQRAIQNVWNRWRIEYLNTLQQRGKWRENIGNLTPGTLVLLRETHCAPLEWPTAKVIEVYPGKDGIVRVVRVQTRSGQYKRPVAQLSPLLPACDGEGALRWGRLKGSIH